MVAALGGARTSAAGSSSPSSPFIPALLGLRARETKIRTCGRLNFRTLNSPASSFTPEVFQSRHPTFTLPCRLVISPLAAAATASGSASAQPRGVSGRGRAGGSGQRGRAFLLLAEHHRPHLVVVHHLLLLQPQPQRAAPPVRAGCCGGRRGPARGEVGWGRRTNCSAELKVLPQSCARTVARRVSPTRHRPAAAISVVCSGSGEGIPGGLDSLESGALGGRKIEAPAKQILRWPRQLAT